jgi:hypothetical protein
VRTGAPRSRLRVVAPLVIAISLTLAANAASGFEPGRPASIPDSAFQPVDVAAPAASLALTPARTPDLTAILEPVTPITPRERAQPLVQAPRPIVVVAPTPRPAKAPAPKPLTSVAKGAHSISGFASYYCRAGSSPCTYTHPDGPGFDAYAAAGPRLRAALGSWRGRIVIVDGIRVKLIDWCQCYQGQSNEKLLDLYYDVYSRTGTKVTISW